MKNKLILLLLISLVGCNSNTSSFVSSSSSVSTSTKIESVSSSIKEKKPVSIDIYAFNDVHGRVSENRSSSEPGISKLSSYLKSKKNENDNTIIINSGDYWQDTYESGYNKGALLSQGRIYKSRGNGIAYRFYRQASYRHKNQN